MMWKAAGENIVVQIAPRPEQTESGLYLPSKAKVAVEQGYVLAAGPDANGVKTGDTVFFDPKGATKIQGDIVSIAVVDALALIRNED